VTRDSLQHSREKKFSLPIKKLFGLLFGMCRSHHAIETRLHEERKARKKVQKDMNEVKKALYPNKSPPTSGSEERESNPPTLFEQRYVNYENFDPLIHLLPTLAPLTWGLTLSLVVTLISKVPHLMHLLLHLLQSSQDLAW
jgi:hypothetical protein